MLGPYKMILLNLVSVAVLGLGLIIYKYVFPKKHIPFLLLLLLISTLPLISLLRKGAYESGDLSLHVKYAMSFYESLSEGNFIPQWGNYLCGGFGCPYFIFIYLLPYYLISLFHFIGFSFIGSAKLFLALSFLGAGASMFFWAKEEFGKTPGTVAAIFYLFAPYHLVNTHFRVDIAEVVSYVFLPLNFLATKKLIENPSKKWFMLQVLFLTLLIFSHQAISLAFFPFIIAYGVFLLYKKRNKLKILFTYSLSIIFSLVISLFYWLPILLEKQYIYWGEKASISFPKISEFFYSPWRYGFLFQGPTGELSFLVGYVQWITIAGAVFLLFKKGCTGKRLLIFSLISFFSIFLMMQSSAKPLWEIIPVIKNFESAYRMLNLLAFFVSALAAIIAIQINKKLIIVICFLAIATTILNWGNRRVIPAINDSYLKSELQDSFMFGQALSPKWINYESLVKLKKRLVPIEIIDGKGAVSVDKFSSTVRQYKVFVETPVIIKENTSYFPGWKVKVNNKDHPIDYQNPNFPGVITFKLLPGLYKVKVAFADTNVRSYAKLASSVSFASLVFYLLLPIFRRLKPKI